MYVCVYIYYMHPKPQIQVPRAQREILKPVLVACLAAADDAWSRGHDLTCRECFPAPAHPNILQGLE